MYKKVNVQQGSEEWFKCRLGKITASQFDKVITKTGKLSSSCEDVINKNVAELILGGLDEGMEFQSDAMLRGQSLEHGALDFFNFTFGFKFKRVGFLDTEKGFGCSPDGIDESAKIGIELKCPLAHTHVGYLAGNKLPEKYIQQVQGSMLVTGFTHWVFGSYHPDIQSLCVVVKRDDDYCNALKEHLLYAVNEIDYRYERLRNV